MTAVPPLRVLLDEGAPAATAQPFLARGHGVIHHRDVLASGAKDALVAAAAILNDAALLAVDRDMRQMAKRFGNPAEAGRFERLHLIFVNCKEALASKRLEHFMTYLEHEWEVASAKRSRVMWVEISTHYIRSYR